MTKKSASRLEETAQAPESIDKPSDSKEPSIRELLEQVQGKGRIQILIALLQETLDCDDIDPALQTETEVLLAKLEAELRTFEEGDVFDLDAIEPLHIRYRRALEQIMAEDDTPSDDPTSFVRIILDEDERDLVEN